MRMSLVIGLIMALFLTGCATDKGVSDSQVMQLQTRIRSLESELKQKQDENLILKQKLGSLQKTTDSLGSEPEVKKENIVLKMPTAVEIQTALRNAGFYTGVIDGKMGPNTKEAIVGFQKANGLNPDGVVGSRTWETLSKYLKSKQ